MKTLSTLFLILHLTLFAHAEDAKVVDGFSIKMCSSGINHATRGDEYVEVRHDNLTFHAKILHPIFVNGPRVSSPFFWVSDGMPEANPQHLTTTKNHIGVLSWLSVNQGFFFSQVKGEKCGFFFEDGFDNWDNGSSGLIYLFDGKAATLFRWVYTRDPAKPKGKYEITFADDSTKTMQKEVSDVITPILKLAETEANYWPGP